MPFDDLKNTAEIDVTDSNVGDRLRRFYIAPRMRKAGNLYEVTLGGSPGSGDSVNTATTSVPSGGKRGSSPPFPHP